MKGTSFFIGGSLPGKSIVCDPSCSLLLLGQVGDKQMAFYAFSYPSLLKREDYLSDERQVWEARK